MKKLLLSLAAVLAFAGFASAQPAAKVAVVDIGKVFDGHPKTQEYREKLKADEAKANDEIARLMKEGEGLVAEIRDLEEQIKSPALSDSGKKEIQEKGRLKVEDAQRKQAELNSFRQNTARSIQQRFNTFRDQLAAELSQQATDIAKGKGATLLINKGALVYFDPAYDITAELIKQVGATDTPVAAAPAAKPAATGGEDTPKVVFPGAK